MSRPRRIAAIVAGIVLVLAAAVGLYRVAAAPPEPMKSEELARYVRHVASLARETALLADQIVLARVTDHFAETHRLKLAKEVEDQARALQAPVPPQLAEAGARARSLTAKLAAKLDELESHLTDADFLDETGRDVARLAEELATLEPPQ